MISMSVSPRREVLTVHLLQPPRRRARPLKPPLSHHTRGVDDVGGEFDLVVLVLVVAPPDADAHLSNEAREVIRDHGGVDAHVAEVGCPAHIDLRCLVVPEVAVTREVSSHVAEVGNLHLNLFELCMPLKSS